MNSTNFALEEFAQKSIYSCEKKMNQKGKAELSSYEDYTRKSGNYDKTRSL